MSEAIEEFRKAAALDPRLPRVHYYLGLTYLLKDGSAKLAEAAKEMQLELAAHPDEFLANYYLGLIHGSEGKWQASLVPLEKASQLQPSNPDPYFLLGQAYQSVGAYEKAIEAFRKAITFNPRLDHNDYQVTNAHYRLGQSLMKVGRTEEGQKELQLAADLKAKAFNSDKEKLDAYLTAGSKREQDTFKEMTVKGVAAEPKTLDQQKLATLQADAAFYEKVIAAAHNNIGMLRAERQDFRSAVDQFRLALKWNPQQEGLNFNLGLASYKAQMYKDAIAPFESELGANPANIAAKQFLGLSYFAVENYAKAAALLTEVVAAKPNDAALYYPLAVSLGMEGKKDDADRVIRQMVALGGSSPQVHILLGRAYYGKNDSAKALEELKAAIAVDNKVLLAHFYSGLIYVKSGKLDDAAKEFEAELILNPGDVEAKYHLAFVALARQETARGINLMREVIRDKPDYANAHFELGNALLKQGDVAGAISSLEKAAKLQPDEAHIHYQLGRAYIAAGRRAEGEGQLEVARQIKEKALRQTNP
jgi:tetratricopeptide (TPR) repeat protein